MNCQLITFYKKIQPNYIAIVEKMFIKGQPISPYPQRCRSLMHGPTKAPSPAPRGHGNLDW
jgi:hypothetical protein